MGKVEDACISNKRLVLEIIVDYARRGPAEAKKHATVF